MKLTLAVLKKIVPQTSGKKGYSRLWDNDLKGFGVKVFPSGRKTFVYRYRIQGKLKEYSLGQNLTLHDARKVVAQKALLVAGGFCPIEEEQLREMESITFKNLGERYLREYVQVRNKPRTYLEYKRYLGLLYPVLGHLRIKNLNENHFRNIQDKARKEQGLRTSNIIITMLKKMFSLATEIWGLLEHNPVMRIKKFREEPRYQHLNKLEFKKLLDSINQEKDISVRSFFTVLIYTASRRGELAQMKWSDIDLEKEIWVKPTTKTGEAHIIPLSKISLENILSLPKKDSNSYVFAGRKKGKPIGGFSRFWSRIKARADIRDLTIHDIRRSVGSLLLQNGESIEFVSQILGHRSIKTTERVYAKLNLEVKKRTLDKLDHLLK